MKDEPIRYRVQLADPAGHRYAIRLTIPQPDPKGQTLRLPAWIPGSYLIRDFARQIETLQARDADGAVAARKTDSHTWRCAPARGALTIDYTVYAWDLSVRGAHFDESHAFFNGCSLFPAVAGQESSPCLLELCPPGHARGWQVHTSLPPAAGQPDCAEPHGFGSYRADDYDALIDHPVEIGTPQSISFEAHGAVHRLVFTGVAPQLDLERIAADVRKICAAQIELFEPAARRAPFLDSADHYTFLTTITGDGYGGLEHRASTALMISRRDLPMRGRPAPEGYQTFLGLVSHEYFHTWNVKRIKPAAFAPYDLSRPDHTRLLWVFEGFTSYYDDLMLLRSGVIDEPAYLKLLARTLDQVMRGGGRLKQSVADSSFDAWTRYYKQDENSPNALVSYYTKGSLVALGLDLEIRHRSGHTRSLDDVMRLLWTRYGRDFYRGRPRGVPEDALPALIQQATGVDLGDFIVRYAEGCADVPLKAALARAGIALTAEPENTRPTLDVRTRPDTGGLRLATVYEEGPAHRAGLSAGDLLIALDGLRITDAASLDTLLDGRRAGDRVALHVFRRDELRQYRARLGQPPALKHKLERSAPETPPSGAAA
ncbi:PDZ domain-containing protein [uncultured Castellaniella sp.]|uniref:M61 family metallopeptidase n=1 Tax=uncultured Castellaniella sp. TaxID=647907 RepID=UPI00261266CF|nr:PDZ domain-containing protein [uncultured Castellaniella sp.]